MPTIRTRFAPSPTGYLHIGGARTALFCWAYARKHGGQFILRIEDTDLERSTKQSEQAILDSMRWLNLDYDEGPFFQMQGLPRYQEAAEKLIAEGKAYRCDCTKERLDAVRAAQRERSEKPRYDGHCRDRAVMGKSIIRFKNPMTGDVAWDDQVKGPIMIANSELDDVVIMRSDGVPTYNFGVVIDDIDMNITHVIRGDDHVNNTPRQINIYKALGATLPRFGHVPMILGADGERLSKRHGAVSCMQYHDEGYLPEALINYLARLGWSHGDDEKFTMAQMAEWFDLGHISKSPARFNPEKLLWLNQQYIKESSDDRLAVLTEPFLTGDGCEVAGGPPLASVIALLKERANTLVELANACQYFYRTLEAPAELKAQHYIAEVKPALADLHARLASVAWDKAAIGVAIKEVLVAHKLKMPKLAMPLRVMVTGQAHTPAIDATLELIGRDRVLARIAAQLPQFP
jgi:glutamyl-tRNA synthetase